MNMETSPKIGPLIAGCWVARFGIFLSLGIFLPKFRGRWGRAGQGARMSLFSQNLWVVIFILFGSGAIASAFQVAWVGHIFPVVFLPLFAVLLIMGWRDNKNRNDKDVS